MVLPAPCVPVDKRPVSGAGRTPLRVPGVEQTNDPAVMDFEFQSRVQTTMSKYLAVISFGALLGGLAVLGNAEAADVKVINRISVDCVVGAGELAIPVASKSEVSATIPDELGLDLKATCDGSGLDKDETACNLIIGGAGGSGDDKDRTYDFKFVKQIHVFAQVGHFLVCSSI